MSRRAGFTLLEVLLALVLAAVLVGSVSWTLAAGFAAHRRAHRVVEPARALSLALETLRADIRGVVRPGGGFGVEFRSLDEAVAGVRAPGLILYTTAGLERDNPSPGLRCVEWVLAPDPDATEPGGLALVRRVSDTLLAPLEWQWQQMSVLHGVEQFELRFHDGSDWQDTWDAAARGEALPVAVELTLAFDAAGEAVDPRRPADERERLRRVVHTIALPQAALEGEGLP